MSLMTRQAAIDYDYLAFKEKALAQPHPREKLGLPSPPVKGAEESNPNPPSILDERRTHLGKNPSGMDFIHYHLSSWEIDYRQTYKSPNPFKEYLTCVQGKGMKEWTCIEGAYEKIWDIDTRYDYKVMEVYTLPQFIREKIFAAKYPDHTLR